MHVKKAQITIFLLFGFVVLIGISLVIYASGRKDSGQMQSEAEFPMEAVVAYVESCIRMATEEGIYFISSQGGYSNTPEKYFDYDGLKIPFYFYNGNESIPDISLLEQELSAYVTKELPGCIKKFNSNSGIGLAIKKGAVNATAVISGGFAQISVDCPLELSSGNVVANLDKFQQSVRSDLLEDYELIRRVCNSQMEDTNSVPIGAILMATEGKPVTFDIENITLDSALFSFIFMNYSGSRPLIYSYGVKYNWSWLNSSVSSFGIAELPEFYINYSGIFEYQVNSGGKNLNFSSSTELFKIGKKTGLVRFDSSHFRDGEYDIFISAADEAGNTANAFTRAIINRSGSRPIMMPIGNLTAILGQEFYYKINASDPMNEFLLFLDDSSFFDINPITGEIRFIPDIAGNYTTKISAINSYSLSYEYLNLEVK